MNKSKEKLNKQKIFSILNDIKEYSFGNLVLVIALIVSISTIALIKLYGKDKDNSIVHIAEEVIEDIVEIETGVDIDQKYIDKILGSIIKEM